MILNKRFMHPSYLWWLFYVSTWLGHWVSKHLIKQYSECVCEHVSGCELTLESVDWVKQIVLPNVGSLHPINQTPDRTKALSKKKFLLPLTTLSWDIRLLLPLKSNKNIGSFESWACLLFNWNIYHCLFWLSGLWT